MNKGILLILLMVGIVLIAIAIAGNQQLCPTQKIIYKYVPRTFDEEQDEPVYASDIFKTMFTQPSAWNSGLVDYDKRKRDAMNKYFISQM
jgi:hypothetical protein